MNHTGKVRKNAHQFDLSTSVEEAKKAQRALKERFERKKKKYDKCN